MSSVDLIDDRYSDEMKTQQKLALIFNKAENIINELNYYRQQQTESFYYDPLKQMKLVKVVELTVVPLRKPCESVGSQTQCKIGRQITQFDEQMSGVLSTNQSEKKYFSSRMPSKFASTIVVKEICLNTPIARLDKSQRKTSRSKGISILSESPCKTKSSQKTRIKIKLGKNVQKKNFN